MNERLGVGWKVNVLEAPEATSSQGSVLISRGNAPDDDEISAPSAALRLHRGYAPSLKLSGSSSRKRKIIGNSKNLLSPVTAGVSTAASPTTQIARKIDSIHLDAGTPVGHSASGLPVVQVSEEGGMEEYDDEQYGPMSLVVPSEEESQEQSSRGRGERMRLSHETPQQFSSASLSLRMESTSSVPEVAKNVEVVSNNDLTLERELARSDNATLMKRTISDDESGEEEEETGRKIPKVTKERVASPRMSAIRVPTIIGQPVVPTLPFALSVYPSSSSSPASTSPRRRPRSRQCSPGDTPSSPSPTREHKAAVPGLSPPANSPIHSRISNFSISELSKSDKAAPPQTQQQQQPLAPTCTAAFFHPGTGMLLLPQLASVYPWHLATMTPAVFQGDPAEKDDVSHVSSVHRIDISTCSVPAKQTMDHRTSPLGDHHPSSPILANRVSPHLSMHYSPKPSPAKSRSPLPPSNSSSSGSEKEDLDKESSEGYHSLEQAEGHQGGAERERGVERERGTDSGERNLGINDGRQNALLQVSEAHLAILPDEDGDTPLHLAVIHENFPLTLYLVRLIVGVYFNLDIANNLRQTPLHLAVITKQPMVVQLLVQAGASVNFPDRRGNTCIHLASQRRDLRTLQILSQASNPVPDFNIKNFSGLTPVHVATREGCIEVLKFLFQMRANKNAPDACSGRSPLHYAVESENLALCNFLLENGCNVNSTTFSGNTPLHIAAGRKLKEIVALLMAYGANPAIANGEGDFPSDLPASLLMQRAKMNAH